MSVRALLGAAWLTGCAVLAVRVVKVLRDEQRPDQHFRRFEAGHPELASLRWPQDGAENLTAEVDAFLERLFAG